jgi:hypothetical protein
MDKLAQIGGKRLATPPSRGGGARRSASTMRPEILIAPHSSFGEQMGVQPLCEL